MRVRMCVVFLLLHYCAFTQDTRVQYPKILQNSFVGVNIGYINYPFSALQLKDGYTATTINIPHVAVRMILAGHHFNKYLSAQISYMRPVGWVEYRNVNGDGRNHSVWMNVAGLTVTGQLPLSKKFSLFAEGGLGIITRKGFKINGEQVIDDATYSTVLLGGGIKYRVNNRWDLMLSTVYSPKHEKDKQPHTLFFSGGFNYTMRKISAEKAERNQQAGYIFSKHLLQLGYTTNGWGYGVNDLFSKKLPIFWGGEAHVSKGFSINYQRNIFHTRKVFSLNWGAGFSYWKSRSNKEEFVTASVYPVMRFTAFRFKPLEIYFNYSVAGPTFISRKIIDAFETGKKFTFQDFMGMGVFAGKKRNLNAEIKIAHYSNGNIYPRNEGVKIPLTFNLGFAF